MAQFREPGENGLPDDFADQLDTAYNQDVATREAQIHELGAASQAAADAAAKAQAETVAAQAHNYRLLMQTGGSPAQGSTETTASEEQSAHATMSDYVDYKKLGER